MPTTESHHCPDCGEALSSPEAECVHCLLDLGSRSVLNDDIESGSDTPFEQKIFGDYELLDEIARGGMGVVYRARQQSLDRVVALKLILAGQLASRELVHRFRTEAAAAAALQHPNIVSIHEVGVHQGNHFFSMEFVAGQNLGQLVGNRPMPAMKAARYLKEIAEAIEFAHGHGILHRDLKPSNVLVDASTDHALVTDFGLAKRLDGESSLTMTGQVLGSPPFMPPEQADSRRGRVGRRSDVYSLGGILYFLLTARAPFVGESLEAILGQVFESEPISPRLLNASVPRDLETICLKCLNKEPRHRYASAKAVGEELGRFLVGEPTFARPTSRIERAWRWCRRKPAVAGFIASVSIILLILAVGLPIVTLRIQDARQIAEANLYSSDLNVVQAALMDPNLQHARELLDRHRPQPGERDHRGFEWRYLWSLCQGDEAFVFEPLIGWPRRLLFSPDGRFLAAGQASGNLSVLWDLTSKAVVQTLPKGDRPVAFHPNAPTLVTAGINGLKLWDTQSWEESALGPCHESAVAVFSPDGKSLVVYGEGLQVWDTQDWSPRSSRVLRNINYWVTSTLNISSDSSLLSCADGVPYVSSAVPRLYQLPSLELVPWSEQLPKDVSSTAFHSSQALLATGGWSGDIRLWDCKTGRERPSEMKQSSRIMAMAFSPSDPNLLATTGGDRSIRLWDIQSQKERTRFHGAFEELEELVFSPNGNMIATGGHANPISLWDPSKRKSNVITIPSQTRSAPLGYSRDEGKLMTIDMEGRLMLRDPISLAPSEPVLHLDMGSAMMRPRIQDLLSVAIEVSPDSRTLALGMTSGNVVVWDLRSRTNTVLKGHSVPVRALAFSPEARHLTTVGDDGEIILWELGSPASQVTSARLEQVSDVNWGLCVRYSPDGKVIAVGSGEQLSLLDSTNLGREVPVIEIPFLLSLRFSPDGRHLTSGHDGGVLRVWDTRSWNYSPLLGHEMAPSDITFSPDGRRMVSGGDKVIVWDTETWQQLATYKLPTQDIGLIIFSPDGNDLVTCDPSAIRVWRAASFEEIEDKESKEGRWRRENY